MAAMSSDAPGPRPRQITLSGWVIVVASVLLVAAVFDAMAGLHSVHTREAVTKALASGSDQGLGISVDDALTMMRWALFVAGAAASVTAVLGVFVLQRHTAARVVLTAAAVAVVLTVPVVMTASGGGIFGLVVGVAAGMLWTEPARDWYAGRPVSRPEPRPSTHPPASHAGRVVTPVDSRPEAPPEQPTPPAPGPSTWPPPTSGPATWAPPASGPPAWAPPASRAAPAPSRVPRPVRVACVLTWVFSALTGGVYTVLVATVAVDRDGVLDLLRDNAALRDSSLDDQELVGALVAVSALVVVWCVLASVLAALTWRRHRTARRLLLVSIGVATLVELLGMPYSLLHFVAGLTAFYLLLAPRARAWFDADRRVSSSSSRQAWPPPGGRPQPPPRSDPPPVERPPGKPPVW